MVSDYLRLYFFRRLRVLRLSRSRSLAALGTAMLAGCAYTPPPTPEQLIPVTRLVNSLKCEYARFLTEYRGTRLQLKRWTVTGSMDLNVVTSNTFGGGVGAGGLVPFQGADLGVDLSGEVTRKNTVAQTVEFGITSAPRGAQICDTAGDLLVEGGLGFGAWLTGLASDLDQAAGGDPKFAVSKLSYQAVFGLERAGGLKGSVVIVPLTVSAKALASRNDVQTLKIEMNPPEIIVSHKADGTPVEKKVLRSFGIPKPEPRFSPLVVPKSN